jgi:serine/threonine protein phosphatase 1
MYNELQLILSRILPLRKSDGGRDRLVFLGDYVDRRVLTHKTIDMLIGLKQDFPEQVFFLRGNHELMMLSAIKPNSTIDEYKLWMYNGGSDTLAGYLMRAGSDHKDPFTFQRNRICSIIPKEHIQFLSNLLPYYETDDFIFVHGGCDPFMPLEEQDPIKLAWDRSVYHSMKRAKFEMPWKKLIVTGHNGEKDGRPFFGDKFWMIDGSYQNKLYVFEMMSRSWYSASKGNRRLVKEG